ncbi:MAG: DEAD/DEAH box helicase [Hyphomicrobiaceae bacterium]
MTFSELGLPAAILKTLEAESYTTPTPIQEQAIPVVLAGSDLLGIAQTGTGKTAAFALPILARLAAHRPQPSRKRCRVLVLAPTRELAAQIGNSFRVYGRHIGVTVAVAYGGVSIRPQISALARGVDVLVATPGRLLDHVGERTVDLSGTEIFVLDEADQMLDLGFVKPIRRIASHLPSRRQSLFFSATMPREIAGLAEELLDAPVRIAVTPVSSTAERVAQRVVHIEAGRKGLLLAELLADAAMLRTLVFTRTKRGADRVAKHLGTNGIAAAAIHGNKSQRQREEALSAFRSARTRVLVATDIAARGIDIDGITHVVNYELPEVPEAYVHRIGRTARAGASGQAVSFCAPDERDRLRAIERLTRQSIPSEDRRVSTESDAHRPAPPRHRQGDKRNGAQAPRANGSHARPWRADHHRDDDRKSFGPNGHRDSGERSRNGGRRDDRREHQHDEPRGSRPFSRHNARPGAGRNDQRQPENGHRNGKAENRFAQPGKQRTGENHRPAGNGRPGFKRKGRPHHRSESAQAHRT